MKPKIFILGSTGKLGIKLLNFCSKNQIQIFGITCFKNSKKLSKLKLKHNIKNSFSLANAYEKLKFIKFLKNQKIDLIYFLDYGSSSLEYANYFLKNNSKSTIAIANKEMIIAGGTTFIKLISETGNNLLPLDSEHFSLFNKNIINHDISKIFITASGGPFYYKKKVNLLNVKFHDVINHPKWKMGINNSIDSSNFINKVLEIYELSSIFNIDISKIDFLVSKEAFVHSLVIFYDSTLSLNCFENDMMISLKKPLFYFFKLNIKTEIPKKIFNTNNFKLEIFKDKRFKIYNYFNYLKKLNHSKQIQFMLLNNRAHKLYLAGKIKYDDILKFIMNNLTLNNNKTDLSSISKILKYISKLEKKYEIL